MVPLQSAISKYKPVELKSFPAQMPLSRVLFDRCERKFGTLAPVPSNVLAIESALLFACGVHSFVAILGPSGWGKSHLLESVAYGLAHDLRQRMPILSATDWLSLPHLTDPTKPLLLDDVQDAYAKTRTKVQLRLALERRIRAGRPTLLSFTAPRSTRQLRHQLPSMHLWTVAAMTEPAATERLCIVNHMASAEGLALSPTLAKLLANRMKGNGRTLLGAMKRLRLHGSVWLDSRATLKACGILNPFFSDNSAWDLKAKMDDAAHLTSPNFRDLPWHDLLSYAMLREANLPESEIAQFLRCAPAVAYQRAASFQTRLSRDENASDALRQYVDQVVELLVKD